MFWRKKVPAQATILADEGYKYVSNGSHSSKQHETYIVEVHPDGEPAFRTEVTGWVSWPNLPRVGDTVRVLHTPGTHRIKLDLKGDRRFDGDLLRREQEQANAIRRVELLNGPVGPVPPAGPTPPPVATPVPPGAVPMSAPGSATGPTVCDACGSPMQPGEHFCSRCGHRVA